VSSRRAVRDATEDTLTMRPEEDGP
jgi:hypothetical protein